MRDVRKRRKLFFGSSAGLAITLAVVALAVFGGFARASAASSCKELKLLTWQGYTDNSWVKPFEQKYGVKVKSTFIGSGDEEIAKVAAGGNKIYDATNLSVDNFHALLGVKSSMPLDVSRLTYYKQLYPFLQSRFAVGGKVYGVPWTWDINPFLYSTKLFPTPPTSWSVLWDPRLKGKVGVWDDLSTIYIAATVLGFDKPNPNHVFNLSDAELNQVLKKLKELKPNIRTIWSDGGELINLMANGEVQAGLGWSYIYNQLRLKHAPIGRTVFPNQGAHAWVDGWGITPNGNPSCRDMAYNWINWVTGPQMMAKVAIVDGYTPAHPGAASYLQPSLVKSLHMDNAAALVKRAIFKVDPVRRAKYVEIMNEFKAS